MSSFAKLSISILLSITLLVLFTATSVTNPVTKKSQINKDELIRYITEEVHYETLYGEHAIDLDSFVDKALIEALRKNNE